MGDNGKTNETTNGQRNGKGSMGATGLHEPSTCFSWGEGGIQGCVAVLGSFKAVFCGG